MHIIALLSEKYIFWPPSLQFSQAALCREDLSLAGLKLTGDCVPKTNLQHSFGGCRFHSLYVASAGGCGAGAAEPPCCAARLPDSAAALVMEKKQALQGVSNKPPLLLVWIQFPEQYFI